VFSATGTNPARAFEMTILQLQLLFAFTPSKKPFSYPFPQSFPFSYPKTRLESPFQVCQLPANPDLSTVLQHTSCPARAFDLAFLLAHLRKLLQLDLTISNSEHVLAILSPGREA